MKQTYTSANTSINSNKLPKIFGMVSIPAGSVVLDYGSGRYTDHIRDALPGTVYLPYDPYNQPQNVNRASFRRYLSAVKNGEPVTVVCSNVLNVIDDDETVQSIATSLLFAAANRNVTVYVTIYDGDRSGIGRRTGPDQYQRNEPLSAYMRFFIDIAERLGLSIEAKKGMISIHSGVKQ